MSELNDHIASVAAFESGRDAANADRDAELSALRERVRVLEEALEEWLAVCPSCNGSGRVVLDSDIGIYLDPCPQCHAHSTLIDAVPAAQLKREEANTRAAHDVEQKDAELAARLKREGAIEELKALRRVYVEAKVNADHIRGISVAVGALDRRIAELEKEAKG